MMDEFDLDDAIYNACSGNVSTGTVTSSSPVLSSRATVIPKIRLVRMISARTPVSSAIPSSSDSVFGDLSVGEARHLRQWWGGGAARILPRLASRAGAAARRVRPALFREGR